MTDLSSQWNRLSTIVTLVENAPNENLGHTAIMKLVYFLQTLCHVHLGYYFRLYIYGPFDSDVLGDLSYAEALGAVTSKLVLYSRGYGYEVRRGENTDYVKNQASEFLDKYRDKICRVAKEFGDRSAADLETISTIIYVDRELQRRNSSVPMDDIAQRVRAIKPHLTFAQIQSEVQSLYEKKLLQAVSG